MAHRMNEEEAARLTDLVQGLTALAIEKDDLIDVLRAENETMRKGMAPEGWVPRDLYTQTLQERDAARKLAGT